MSNIKTLVNLGSFAAGSMLGYLFGPLDPIVQGFLVMAALDIVLGVVSGICGVSSKTQGGKISSKAMILGLGKKCAELVMIIVGNMLDMATGLSITRSGVCAALLVAETISVLENASSLGVINIPIINDTLEYLQGKKNDDKP